MKLYNYMRISKPSEYKVAPEKVQSEYKKIRNCTFWGAVVAYSLFYVCRMSLSIIKQPMIDSGVLSASQLGLVGSSMLFVYAIGKFVNGFIADYCNIKKFMAIGLLVSSILNLVMGIIGIIHGFTGFSSTILLLLFFVLWGLNGWVQSMGAPPGIINLSRWFPLSKRGTFYSIFSATPYLGEFLTFIIVGFVVGAFGWEWGFIFSAIAGFIGVAVILLCVKDTPESQGLPSVQELSGEKIRKVDTMRTRELQKKILRHPGIWVIAISSAFIYITKYAVAGWGVLFLQKSKTFSLEEATQIIAFSAIFGVVGTVLAGWLSDNVFKGDRVRPAILSGILSTIFLACFLLCDGGYVANIIYVSLFSLSIGVLYCIVAGLMAVDIVPRKATGAVLGVVGISSYLAAGAQDIVSGVLIEGYATGEGALLTYNFLPVSIFWLCASVLSFVLPVLNWKRLQMGKLANSEE